ncbi:hypothetical protein [Hutsoniella sourekii]|uniref:hypothetical protein n=1 Tax=Hutsoniella sourekii TaxID=87650 RepID=UPI000489E0CE|nr:hypothetical protein [Hutsoniella sourekii]
MIENLGKDGQLDLVKGSYGGDGNTMEIEHKSGFYWAKPKGESKQGVLRIAKVNLEKNTDYEFGFIQDTLYGRTNRITQYGTTSFASYYANDEQVVKYTFNSGNNDCTIPHIYFEGSPLLRGFYLIKL